MNEQQQSLETLQDIKRMMERSGRFISLSGLSGVSAGICALVGAAVAYPYVERHKDGLTSCKISSGLSGGMESIVQLPLFWIAAATFCAALLSSFIFTFLKSRREHTALWGSSARRLLINVSVPLLAGGFILLRLIQQGNNSLLAPGCLIFYGLALINASKYTLNEIRYLGYCQIILGIIGLWYGGYGLYLWAFGFGVLHIVYGAYMWWKYEKNLQKDILTT
ncbi:MAG: hypothetical protein JSU03_13380 [Bacteroidetes bacterium]|nr:hypothetical protein [Bacteroidota bacterium]MBS1758261.1 hypothetical protein [Bacteroidota bacterium]